jgi:hypothetical protein
MPNLSLLPIKQIDFACFASLLVSSSPRRLDAHTRGLRIILVHRSNRLRLISLASTAFSIGSHSRFPRRQRPSSPMSCTGPLPQGAAMAMDTHPTRSVAYVSFGTVAELESSGAPFLWPLREDSWPLLPAGFLARAAAVGVIVAPCGRARIRPTTAGGSSGGRGEDGEVPGLRELRKTARRSRRGHRSSPPRARRPPPLPSAPTQATPPQASRRAGAVELLLRSKIPHHRSLFLQFLYMDST